MNLKTIGITALIAAVVALGVVMLVGRNTKVVTVDESTLGASGTRFPSGLAVSSSTAPTEGKLLIGNSGTAIGQVLHGTCNIVTAVASFVASTTQQFVCSVTGVQNGDRVLASLPVGAGAKVDENAGSGQTTGGFGLVSAFATTTDRIGFTLANWTGAATSSYRQATTGIQYWIFR